MIALTRLGKAFADRTLFEDVSLNLNRGSRYGLVGANGAGKTTLLKILAGDEPASEGTVSIPHDARMGVLRQDRFLDGSASILDVAMRGDERVYDLLRERDALLAGEHPDPTRAAALEESLASLDGYTLEARTGAILVGLGIPAMDVILAATRNAADLLGLRDLGQIKPGYIADLVVVDGDPLTDIHTLERPTLVLQSGAIVRDELPRPAP